MENEKTLKFNPEDMMKAADERFLELMKNGKYAELLATMPTLGRYSLRNQLLILMQNPNATNVNQMRAWNYQKRHIVKGEKAIKIITPKFGKQVVTDENGNAVEKTLDKITGYEVGFVYDAAQTDGDEPLKDVLATGATDEHYDLIRSALQETAKGYEFKTHDESEDKSHAILDTLNKTISIRSDLSKEDSLLVLIRQVATANVLGRDRRNFQGLTPNEMENIRAVETSAIAFTVAKRLHLEDQKLTIPDFKDMQDADIAKFADNLGVIRSVSQRMINTAEGAVNNYLYEQAKAQAEQEASKSATTQPEQQSAPAKPTAKRTTQRTKKAEVAM